MPDTIKKADTGEQIEVFPDNDVLDRLFDDNEKLEPSSKTGTGNTDDKTGNDDTSKADDTTHAEDEKVDTTLDDLSLDDTEQSDKNNPDDETDLDTEPADETMARKQAKERGREAKRLRTELEEARLKLRETEEQAKQYQTRLSEVESSVVDPRNHPDYRALLSEMRQDVLTSAEVLDIEDPSVVTENFGVLMKGYIELDGLSGKERSDKLQALRGLIVDKIIKPGVPYEEMTPEERSVHSPIVAEVLRVVQRNRPTMNKLYSLEQTLADQAKKGILSRGSRAYEIAVNDLRPVVDSVGTLTDDLIDADPHSPAAIVSRLAKNPDNRVKIDKAKRDVIEVLVGPPALTPEQVKSMEDAGTDVKEFLVERDKRLAARRRELAPLLVEAILTRSITRKALKALLDTNDSGKSAAKEVAVLRNTGKRAPVQPKNDEQKVDLMERLFDESEELR